MSSQDLRKIVSILYGNAFDDSTDSSARSLFMVESDTASNQEEQHAEQIQVKSNSVSNVSKFLDQVLHADTGDDNEDASNKIFYAKLLDLLRRFDLSQIVALVKLGKVACYAM